MWIVAVAPTAADMETSAGLGASQLFLTEARLVLGLVNHLRYQALDRTLGLSREQAKC
jgi:hypothetical protein